MSKKKVVKGNCYICNEYGKLTFEHIPPKSVFNDKLVKVYQGDSYAKLISDKNRYPWEKDGIKYKSQQRGMGGYTLCERCNNITGKFYGEEYKKWVYTILSFINKNRLEFENSNNATVTLKGTYPGRFIRQVLSMICSTYPGFTEQNLFVKEMLLNRDFVYKDVPPFKIYMYLLKNPYLGYTSLAGLILKKWKLKFVDEVDVYPFGFILSLSAEEKEMDITKFMNLGYNDKADIELIMNTHEKNNHIPLDFRSKAEIIEASSKQKN